MKQFIKDMKHFIVVLCVFTFIFLGFTVYHYYETPHERAEEITQQILRGDFSEIPGEFKRPAVTFKEEIEKIEYNNINISANESEDGDYLIAMLHITNMSKDNSIVLDAYSTDIKMKFTRVSWTHLEISDMKISTIR